MGFKEGFKLVQKAYAERDKEKWFQVYLTIQPMSDDGEHLKPFSEWHQELKDLAKQQEEVESMEKEDILLRVAKIRGKVVNDANI